VNLCNDHFCSELSARNRRWWSLLLWKILSIPFFPAKTGLGCIRCLLFLKSRRFIWNIYFLQEVIYSDLCYKSFHWSSDVWFCNAYLAHRHNWWFEVSFDHGLIYRKWRTVENLYTTCTLQYLTCGKGEILAFMFMNNSSNNYTTN